MDDLALLDDEGLMDVLRARVEHARSTHASVLAMTAEARARGLELRAGVSQPGRIGQARGASRHK